MRRRCFLSWVGVSAGRLSLDFGGERYFKIDWQPEHRDGKPVVSGRFESKYGAAVSRIQLLVEGLDEKGEVISRTVAWIGGDISPFGRAYFEVPVQKFPHHRLSVFEPPPSIGRDAETLSGVLSHWATSLPRPERSPRHLAEV